MKEKCYADMGIKCYGLSKKKCENCKFFRTDRSILEIERDIKLYENGAKKKYD